MSSNFNQTFASIFNPKIDNPFFPSSCNLFTIPSFFQVSLEINGLKSTPFGSLQVLKMRCDETALRTTETQSPSSTMVDLWRRLVGAEMLCTGEVLERQRIVFL
jgi:hypothetical protein